MVIGEKIKNLRLQSELTQEELADRCELTKGYISQLENDLTSPSIATLIDILTALSTNLNEFFSDAEEQKVVFSPSEFIEKKTDAYTWNWLVPNAKKNLMEAVVVELNPLSRTEDDFPHDGEEFGYVTEGEICVVLGGKKIPCKKGESFYFSSDRSHYIVNKKNKRAVFIWASSPPNF